MKNKLIMLACGFISMGAAAKETITIATVNNGDMITMKELSSDFTSQNPDIDLKWVTLGKTFFANVSQPMLQQREANTML
ncbi:hypothetical protein P4S63_23925 [Pseudoalteromonas sp. B193]